MALTPFGQSISRRGFLRAGAATGAALAAVSVLAGCTHPENDQVTAPTVVDDASADYVLDPQTGEGRYAYVALPVGQSAEWDIALGNVLHPAEGTWIPVTTAGSSASPMVKGSALSTSDGALVEVVSAPVSREATNVAVYDVRCSDSAYAWVELNLLTHAWSLYAARFANGQLVGAPSTLWEADDQWDPPLFAVSGSRVLWQVAPALSGGKTTEKSYCYLWKVGDANARAVVESPGRFATEPAVSGDTVTLAPRVNASQGTYYGITAYSLSDDLETQVDRLVLPQGVRPMNAVRIADKFAFSVEANYSSGGLLGQMGTYIGAGEGPFTVLSREPAAAVAGREGFYLVRASSSYFAVNTADKTYSILAAANRCIDYGEFPARVGECSSFVTFSTVKAQDTGYPSSVAVRSFDL